MNLTDYIIRAYQHDIGKYLVLLSLVLIIIIGVIAKDLYNHFQLMIKVFQYNKKVLHQQKVYNQRVYNYHQQRQTHHQNSHKTQSEAPVYDSLLQVPKSYRALGLTQVPESLNDIKQVYRKKIKTLHPDVGGNPEDFKKFQRIYEEAVSHWKLQNPK